MRGFSSISRVLLPGRAFYIWGGGYPGSGGAKGNHETYPQFMRIHELKYAQLIIWDKLHPLTRKDYMGRAQIMFLWVERRRGSQILWAGQRYGSVSC